MAKEANTEGQRPRFYKGQPVPDWMPDSLFEPEKPSKDLQIALLQLSTRLFREGLRRIGSLLIRAATRIPDRGYNGIDTRELSRRMRKINWNKDYYSSEALSKGVNSPRMQRQIMRVNSIFRDLKKLSDSGHYMAEELRWKLQYKYWSNTRMRSQIGNTLETVSTPAINFKSDIQPATGYNQGQGNKVSPRNGIDTSARKQQNEVRRKLIAKAGANLTTSMPGRQHRRKKGLGI